MKYIIINLPKSDAWKIQLTIAVKLISSKDADEEQTMHSKSDNMEVMAFDDTDEIIEELFDSLLFRYQISLETQMRGSGFIFDCVNVFS